MMIVVLMYMRFGSWKEWLMMNLFILVVLVWLNVIVVIWLLFVGRV